MRPIARCLPEGRDLTRLVELEHQEISELWVRLDHLPPLRRGEDPSTRSRGHDTTGGRHG